MSKKSTFIGLLLVYGVIEVYRRRDAVLDLVFPMTLEDAGDANAMGWHRYRNGRYANRPESEAFMLVESCEFNVTRAIRKFLATPASLQGDDLSEAAILEVLRRWAADQGVSCAAPLSQDQSSVGSELRLVA